MGNLILVMVGGAIGAGARYCIGRAIGGEGFPWATLTVNVAGGLAMGCLAGVIARGWAGEPARLLLGVGVLGGFTTFSAFSLELVTLAERGAWGLAAGYAIASVAGAALALVAGLAIARGLA